MTEYAEHIANLIHKQLNGELTGAETSELEQWKQIARHKQVHEQLNTTEGMVENLQTFYGYDNTRMETLIEHEFPGLSLTDGSNSNQRIRRIQTSWLRYAAAIIILFGVGAYLYTFLQKKNAASPVEPLVKVDKNDIAPGANKAVLTLSDGSIIMLDSAANGQIAVQEGSSIIKKEGNILYDPNQVSSKEVMYNTMSTPRGGQYQLTLPDGTHVWLNAASSITYPTAFIEKQRIVKITGEVYFEVKKDVAKPFIVQTYKDEIKVLGTQFNVNAYSDEPAIKTSLMEGSVQIGNKILKPGQSFLNDKIQQTNIEEDIAWKNGAFSFNKTDLVVAMRQFSRWYDVEIIYVKPDPNKQISGQIGRDLHLSEVLEGLKGLGIITRIEGKRLIVDVK